MKRILIIGSPGSGKSTLAKKISATLKLPIVHLDHLYWLPGNVRRPADEFYDLMMNACKQAAWIMDGNSIRLLAERIPFADTVIFLDMPRQTCMWRIIKRAFRGLFTREEYAPGCANTFRWEFFNWAWHWEERYHDEILRILTSALTTKTFLLKSDDEVAAFLARIK